MIFKCRWFETSPDSAERCKQDASMLIIYGCGNMHINEISFCGHHYRAWVAGQTTQPKKCWHCSAGILEWQAVGTIHIKNHYTPL